MTRASLPVGGIFLILILCSITLGSPAPATNPCPPIIEGRVPASAARPLPPAARPEVKPFLDRFVTPATGFSYRMKLIKQTDTATIWRVLFPSPFVSPDPANNVVWCEYYQARVKGPRPAVIALHPLDLEPGLMRGICDRLAQGGIDSLWLEMAYYGERSYPTGILAQLGVLQDLDKLIAMVCQSVMDIRRATEFMATRPEVMKDQIHLLGCSLGALMGALTMGVDGNYPKAVFMVGGANLPKIFTANEDAVRLLTLANKRNITEENLKIWLKPIEPLTYIDRAKKTQVLMTCARRDRIIPPACGKELADCLPQAQIRWYDVTHVGLPVWDIMIQAVEFFKSTKPVSDTN